MLEDQIFNPARTAQRLGETMRLQLISIQNQEAIEAHIEDLHNKKREIYFGNDSKQLGQVNWDKCRGLFSLEAQLATDKEDEKQRVTKKAEEWITSEVSKNGKKPTEGQIKDFKDLLMHQFNVDRIVGEQAIEEMKQECVGIDDAIKLQFTAHERMERLRMYHKQMAEHATLLEAGQHSVGMQLGENAP